MKTFRASALFLALTLLLTALTGCLGKSERELLTGTWETGIDVSAAVKEHVLDFDSDFDGADFDGLSMPWRMTLREDGTWEAGIPEDGAERLKSELTERLTPVLRERMRSELAKNQKVEPEEITDEQLDGYVGMIGMGTWGEMCRLFVDMMGVEDLLDRDSREGQYLLQEGRLYLSDAAGTEADGDCPSAACKVGEKTLTLSEPDRMPEPGEEYPMTFTRVEDTDK